MIMIGQPFDQTQIIVKEQQTRRRGVGRKGGAGRGDDRLGIAIGRCCCCCCCSGFSVVDVFIIMTDGWWVMLLLVLLLLDSVVLLVLLLLVVAAAVAGCGDKR